MPRCGCWTTPLDEVAWYRLLRLHDGIGPARARDLLDVLRPGDGPDDDRHADAVAAAPPRPGRAAATLTGLSGGPRPPGTAGRAAACWRLLRPLLTAATPTTRRGWRPGPARRRGRRGAHPRRVRRRADPRPAGLHRRPGRPAAPRRGLPDSRTVHSAKGLEWDCVHVIHLVDGAFPSDMALTTDTGLVEEQRLFYVARHPRPRRARPLHPAADAAPPLRRRRPAQLRPGHPLPHQRCPGDPAHHRGPTARPAARRTQTIARVSLPTLDNLWA